MEYMITEAESATELQAQVCGLVAEGWEPQGGVSVAVLHTTWTNDRKGYEESSTMWLYAQALKREA